MVGEIADHPVNLALTTAPVTPSTVLWTGKSLLEAAGLSPGEPVEVRLRPARNEDVETPADLTRALREADLTAAWDALTLGKRRGLLPRIGTPKRDETRAKRIAKLLADL